MPTAVSVGFEIWEGVLQLALRSKQIRLLFGARHGDRLPVNQVQKWPLVEFRICSRAYRVKKDLFRIITGVPELHVTEKYICRDGFCTV